jgi:hypothetical protein
VKSFKIISTSWLLAFFSMMLFIFSGILLFLKILPDNTWIFLGALISLIGAGLYLQRFISIAKIEITLTPDFISLKCIKQSLFDKEANRTIYLNEIKSYKYQEDQNFDLFRLTLKDGTEIDIWHFSFTKDDFKSLVNAFPAYISSYNKVIGTTELSELPLATAKIEREKTAYENASPWLVIIAIVFIVSIVFIMIFKGGNYVNPFLGLSAISGASFYLVTYFKYRKKRN